MEPVWYFLRNLASANNRVRFFLFLILLLLPFQALFSVLDPLKISYSQTFYSDEGWEYAWGRNMGLGYHYDLIPEGLAEHFYLEEAGLVFPLSTLFAYLLTQIIGPNLFAIRFLSFLCFDLSLFLVAFFLRKSRWAPWILLLYLSMPVFLIYPRHRIYGIYLLAFSLCVVCFCLPQKRLRLFLFGAFCGFLALSSPVFLVLVPIFSLTLVAGLITKQVRPFELLGAVAGLLTAMMFWYFLYLIWYGDLYLDVLLNALTTRPKIELGLGSYAQNWLYHVFKEILFFPWNLKTPFLPILLIPGVLGLRRAKFSLVDWFCLIAVILFFSQAMARGYSPTRYYLLGFLPLILLIFKGIENLDPEKSLSAVRVGALIGAVYSVISLVALETSHHNLGIRHSVVILILAILTFLVWRNSSCPQAILTIVGFALFFSLMVGAKWVYDNRWQELSANALLSDLIDRGESIYFADVRGTRVAFNSQGAFIGAYLPEHGLNLQQHFELISRRGVIDFYVISEEIIQAEKVSVSGQLVAEFPLAPAGILYVYRLQE